MLEDCIKVWSFKSDWKSWFWIVAYLFGGRPNYLLVDQPFWALAFELEPSLILEFVDWG